MPRLLLKPKRPHSEEEYGRTVVLMNHLLDKVGDKETHASAGLLDLVGQLVQDHEASSCAIEPSEPRKVLRYLIEVRGLKQGALADIVAQSNCLRSSRGNAKSAQAWPESWPGFSRAVRWYLSLAEDVRDSEAEAVDG